METTAALPTTTTVLQCPTGECSTYGSSKYLIIDIAMTWDEGQVRILEFGVYTGCPVLQNNLFQQLFIDTTMTRDKGQVRKLEY